MPQGDDLTPLCAIALGQDSCFCAHFAASFLDDQVHALQRRTSADDIVQKYDLLALQKLNVLLVQEKVLRFASGDGKCFGFQSFARKGFRINADLRY